MSKRINWDTVAAWSGGMATAAAFVAVYAALVAPVREAMRLVA